MRQLIADLRSRLRQYYALSGILLVFSIAVVTYWVTTGLDSGWFALQRLELPVGLRVILLLAILGGGAWLIVQHLLAPLFRRTRDSELAMILERRFPQFQDRLMTAVESADDRADRNILEEQMLRQTLSEANRFAQDVSASDVFDPQPLKMRSVIAGLLLLSLIGSAVASPGALQRWWNAFIRCQDTYHIRRTQLEFFAVAQPGDRRIPFREANGTPHYKHPLGADFELEVVVPNEHPVTGEPCEVPDRIQVDVIRLNGNPSRTYIKSAGGNTFRFVLTRLQESVSIEVIGGDYRTPAPLRVEAVSPPGLEQLEAECDFPEYTGLNGLRESLVPILSREVSLPIGTEFKLAAGANKPLQSVRIETDTFVLTGDRESSRLTPRNDSTIKARDGGPLLSEDGQTLRATFRLDHTAAPGSTEDETPEESANEIEPPATASVSIASNSSLQFFLHDTDDIMSTSPETLRLRGIPDKPPVIAVRKKGVGNAITRRAIIPVGGVIEDDYGLKSAQFMFVVDDETRWRPRPFRNIFRPVMSYDLEAENGPMSEYFRVEELELSDGQTLALTLVATDGCSIPSPNTSRAEPMVFRIVSPEELLSLLYTRELNQRRRFEDVIAALVAIQTDLEFQTEIAARIDAAGSDEVSPEDRSGLSNSAKLNGDSLRRQNNELKSIVESFAEIREELINNSIPPRQLADDMNTNIIEPLRLVSTGLMDDADRSLSRFRVAATSGQPSSEHLKRSIQDVTKVLAELRRILENVRDMAEFHELYQEGKFIYEDLLRIWEETRELQKKRAIEKLKLLQ